MMNDFFRLLNYLRNYDTMMRQVTHQNDEYHVYLFFRKLFYDN
jgi:hypothetical protein